jgi:hypothetical protein
MEKKAELDKNNERILREKEHGGEILTNFQSPYRKGGMTNNSNAWVIRSDGSLREPDETKRARN